MIQLLCELPKHMTEIGVIADLRKSRRRTTTAQGADKWTSEDRRRLEWAAVTGRAGREDTTNIFGIPTPRLGPLAARCCLVVFHVALGAVVAFPSVEAGPSLAYLVAFVSFSFAGPAFWYGYMYGENGCQGHMCYPLLAALAILTCDGGPVGRVCCQLAIGTAYTAAGLAKLTRAWISGRPWDGNTLAFYIVNAVSLRPFRRGGQRHFILDFMLRSPRLLDFLSYATIVWEITTLPGSFFVPRFYGLACLSFHITIGTLLEVNFIHCWGPSLLVLLCSAPVPELPSLLSMTLPQQLAIALTSIVLAFGLTLFDLRDDAPEIAPLSCFPIFAHACHLHWDAHILCLYAPETPGPLFDPYYVQGIAATGSNRTNGFDIHTILENSPENVVVVVDVRSHRELECHSNCKISPTLSKLLIAYFRLVPTETATPSQFSELALKMSEEIPWCEPTMGRSTTTTVAW